MDLTSNIIIYTTEDGLTKISTKFDEDTVWLSIDQMAELFQRDKSTISRHIKNVFLEGEVSKEATVAKFATVQISKVINQLYRKLLLPKIILMKKNCVQWGNLFQVILILLNVRLNANK